MRFVLLVNVNGVPDSRDFDTHFGSPRAPAYLCRVSKFPLPLGLVYGFPIHHLKRRRYLVLLEFRMVSALG